SPRPTTKAGPESGPAFVAFTPFLRRAGLTGRILRQVGDAYALELPARFGRRLVENFLQLLMQPLALTARAGEIDLAQDRAVHRLDDFEKGDLLRRLGPP